MLHLVVIQAEFGDCFVLEHRAGNVIRRYLIDGGPDGVLDAHLRPYIDAVMPAGAFEAVVLSHVDSDHIIGLLDLFAELRAVPPDDKPFVRVKDLWHNSFSLSGGDAAIDRRIAGVFEAAGADAVAMPATGSSILGYDEGGRLRQEALALGVPVNAPFPDHVILADTAHVLNLAGLSVRVVGPSKTSLAALRRAWLEWLRKHETAVAARAPLAAAKADASIPNLSSVCLLATEKDCSVLLTGDATGDEILANLEAGGLASGREPFHVNVLKMPHHGSDRNVSPAFFTRVTADRYVFSANGRDGNPDMATLVWLVEALRRDGRSAQLVATNRTESLARLVELYAPGTYGYRLSFLPDTSSWLRIPVRSRGVGG